MLPKPEMQNRYHQVVLHSLPSLGGFFFFFFSLSSSSENSYKPVPHKHVYLAKPFRGCPDGAVSCFTLSFSLYSLYPAIATAFSVAGCYGPQCSGCKASSSVCRSMSRFSYPFPPVFQDLILLLTHFTASPHVISLSNYFSSACDAVFTRRRFLSARLAFGLLSFRKYVWLSTHDCTRQRVWAKERVFQQFKFTGISLYGFSFFFFYFLFPLNYSYANMHLRLLHIPCGAYLNLLNLTCYLQVANSVLLH